MRALFVLALLCSAVADEADQDKPDSKKDKKNVLVGAIKIKGSNPGQSAKPMIAPEDMEIPEVSETIPIDGDVPWGNKKEGKKKAALRKDWNAKPWNLAKPPKCSGFIEELKVVGEGSAYVSKIHIGYKQFTCLPDTGSFDLEVISNECEDLKGDGYNRNMSKTYKKFPVWNKAVEDLMFGSGPVKIRKGMEMVSLVDKHGGPHVSCRAQACPIGEIIQTSIKELLLHNSERDFDAVCGIGMGPKDKLHHRLVARMGVQRVGFCFRKDIAKGGIAHWNYKIKDQTARGFYYSTVNNIGPYWGMAVKGARTSQNGKDQIFACQDKPCLAVIDTGTTLHSMDSEALSKFRELVSNVQDLDCNEELYAKLPSICYHDENKNDLCLHPKDYVYEMPEGYSFEQLPSYIRSQLAFTPSNLPNFFRKGTGSSKSGGSIGKDTQCMLAIGDSGEKNMHVFGMQWFKSHWFGFDTVSSAISWAKHDGNCEPYKNHNFREQIEVPKLQTFNPMKIRPSTLSLRLQMAKRSDPSHYAQLRNDIGIDSL